MDRYHAARTLPRADAGIASVMMRQGFGFACREGGAWDGLMPMLFTVGAAHAADRW